MKVLVTGATGFLGGQLVIRLRAQGAWVRALVRPGRGHTVPADEVHEGDLRDDRAVERAIEGIDHVYHAGARVSTSGPWDEFEATNVRATERVIRCATRAGARRIIHVSSLSVYAVPHDGARVTEESAYETAASERGFYARSKLAADQLACQAMRAGAPVVVVRPGVLYGPGRRPPLARRALTLGPVRVLFAHRTYLLPLAYVDNVVDALCLAAEVERAVGRAYSIVDVQVPQAEYIRTVRHVSGDRSPMVFAPVRPLLAGIRIAEALTKRLGWRLPVSRHQIERTVWSAAIDTGRAREELGWQPRVSLEEALRRSLRPPRTASVEPAAAPAESATGHL